MTAPVRTAVTSVAIAALLAACSPAPTSGTVAPPAPATAPAAPMSAADAPATAPPAAAAPVPKDALLHLPGVFGQARSVDDLRRAFGADQVRVGDVPGAEGSTEHGVTLYPDDPARRAYVYFANDTSLDRWAVVQVVEPGSRWTLDLPAGAVRIGTPKAELLHLNGGPFDFSGTGWDYGGYAIDFRGGALSRPLPGALEPSLRFDIPSAWFEAHPDAPSPTGEGTFKTDDPRWPDLMLEVSEIGLQAPR